MKEELKPSKSATRIVLSLLSLALLSVLGLVWFLDADSANDLMPSSRRADAVPTQIDRAVAVSREAVGVSAPGLQEGEFLVSVRIDGLPAAGAEIWISTAPDWMLMYQRPTEDSVVRSSRRPAHYQVPAQVGGEGSIVGVTDALGRLVLPRLDGRAALHASLGNRVSRTLVIEEWQELPSEIALDLHTAVSVAVEVIDEVTGEPVDAAWSCYVELPDSQVQGSKCYLRILAGRGSEFDVTGLYGAASLLFQPIANGYARSLSTASVDAESSSFSLALKPTFHLSGRVTDAALNPIAGAKITGRAFGFIQKAETDEDGRYRLALVREKQKLALTVSALDFRTHTQQLVPGGEDVDFVLEAAPAASSKLLGRVLTADGTPLEFATVELWHADRAEYEAMYDDLRQGKGFLTALSDVDGSFAFDLVRHGIYGLDVLLPTRGGASGGVTVAARLRLIASLEVTSETGYQELRLPATGQLEYLMTKPALDSLLQDKKSWAIPVVQVHKVLVAERKLLWVGQHEILPDRVMSFVGLASGDYVVRTHPKGPSDHIVVHAGEIVRLIPGELSPRITGQVFRGGMPVGGCKLIAGSVGSASMSLARALTDELGAFAFSGLGVGELVIQLRDKSSRIAFVSTTARESQPLRIDWPEGTLALELGAIEEDVHSLRLEIESVAGIDIRELVPAVMRRVVERQLRERKSLVIDFLGYGDYLVILESEDDRVLAKKRISIPSAGVVRVVF